MAIETIERDFHEKVAAKIRLAAEGMERFRVFTPFLFKEKHGTKHGRWYRRRLGRLFLPPLESSSPLLSGNNRRRALGTSAP